jgi:hypothetical protein
MGVLSHDRGILGTGRNTKNIYRKTVTAEPQRAHLPSLKLWRAGRGAKKNHYLAAEGHRYRSE